MIVAVGKAVCGGRIILVGLTETDIAQLRKGLTKTKQGGGEFGFREMIVFLGDNDLEVMKLLKQTGLVTDETKRSDDLFPNAGQG